MKNELQLQRDELKDILFLARLAKCNANSTLVEYVQITNERLEQISDACNKSSEESITLRLEALEAG